MAKIKNKAKYKKSDKNVNISTNEYPDNLQMSLSGDVFQRHEHSYPHY
jgi:hypothetical protein